MRYVDRLDSLIRFWVDSYGLEFDVIKRLVSVLSGGDPLKVGSNGEIGVMQIHPSAAMQLGLNAHDTDSNIKAGCILMDEKLRQVIQTFGDFEYRESEAYRIALAAYLVGFGPVRIAIQSLRQKDTDPMWENFIEALAQVRFSSGDKKIDRKAVEAFVKAVYP